MRYYVKIALKNAIGMGVTTFLAFLIFSSSASSDEMSYFNLTIAQLSEVTVGLDSQPAIFPVPEDAHRDALNFAVSRATNVIQQVNEI